MINNAGIATVNAYCPGIVATDMWVEVGDELAQKTDAEKRGTFDAFVDTMALGRARTARDVAGLPAFLSGPDSDYMTGQSIIMDGGRSIADPTSTISRPLRCSSRGRSTVNPQDPRAEPDPRP